MVCSIRLAELPFAPRSSLWRVSLVPTTTAIGSAGWRMPWLSWLWAVSSAPRSRSRAPWRRSSAWLVLLPPRWSFRYRFPPKPLSDRPATAASRASCSAQSQLSSMWGAPSALCRDRPAARCALAMAPAGGRGAIGRRPGVPHITSCIGSTAEPPISTTSFCSDTGITGWCTRATGSWSVAMRGKC